MRSNHCNLDRCSSVGRGHAGSQQRAYITGRRPDTRPACTVVAAGASVFPPLSFIEASAMSLSHLLLLALTAIVGTSEGQASTFYTTKCFPPPTPTADGGSAFRGHLLGLLADLPSAAAPTGFASLQSAGTDRALVRGLCFGEVIYFSGAAVPSPDVAAVRTIVSLAQSLAPRAANGSVDTAETSTPASKGDATACNRTVHVLAQCARDLGAAGCVGCLRESSLSMATSWSNLAVEGRVAAVLGSDCYLRFEVSTPALSLGEKIRKLIVLTVCVAVAIVVVVGGLIVDGVCGARRRIKARNAAAAAAPGK
uniref:Uncharacterized protein n=1 Tax=Avena sativa TaxID=4498 RepID=A0ACD5UDX6_AVESA